MSYAATIGALFLDTVARHGAREALVFRDRRFTYDELHDRVTAASALLCSMSEGLPRRVAVVGANHPAYAIGYFAAHLLGASTVEVGRDESLANVLEALRATQADIVLTDRADLLAAAPTPALAFDALLEACGERRAPGALPPRTTGENDEASIVFTSGTTGSPKGVILSHRNVLFVVRAVCEYLALDQTDRYALVLPLAHTYGKSNLLSAVAAGAAVVFVENPQDPVGFFGHMSAERCTVLSVVPFHINVIARRGGSEAAAGSALRAITSSGGPLPDSAVERVATLFPNARLFAMYGLTESATRLTYLSPEWLAAKAGSVGRPLPGVKLEIRDDDGRVLPSATPGHVWARGPNVMVGYVGEPALTADTILDGWLRTGDIGYLDADGCLFLTGREKEIIKVAGERISPVEIEEVLASHPAVAEAAVRGVAHPLLGETVWAYIIPRAGADLDDVAAYCAARLSPHKVPRRILRTSCIPRTPTGKVRRFLLAEE